MLLSGLVEGEVELGVRPALPVDSVSVILGNNYAGVRVWQNNPVPVVLSSPQRDETDDCSKQFPDVFEACAVTRSVTRAAASIRKPPRTTLRAKVPLSVSIKGYSLSFVLTAWSWAEAGRTDYLGCSLLQGRWYKKALGSAQMNWSLAIRCVVFCLY